MAFPVIGGTQESGYNIDNSLRFNDDDSPEISFTLNQTPTHQDKGTWSFWIKRANIQSAVVRLYSGYADGGATQTWIRFDANDCLDVANRVGASFNTRLVTNRKFRDPSAWYHIVVAFDTTDGTSSNRAKVYVNSVQETSFSTETYPSQNDDLEGNTSGIQQSWGCDGVNNLEYFDGYFSDVYFIDGQQLAPTEFGETNDNGVWIPKRFSGSFGNNGYKLEFKQLGTAADATSIGADTSGNDNHFSQTNVTPAVDRTEDTPTNNFATLNSLAFDGTLSEGNLKCVTSSGGFWGSGATQGISNGKWYMEFKDDSGGSVFGITDNVSEAIRLDDGSNDFLGAGAYEYSFMPVLGRLYNNYRSTSSFTNFTTTGFSAGDIIGVAFDMDNKKIFYSVDGTFQNSQDPVNGTNPAQTVSSIPDTYFFAATDGSNAASRTFQANFGNPTFSISSGNSDANGYGNFEYAVPSGYYALCTKNLAEFG